MEEGIQEHNTYYTYMSTANRMVIRYLCHAFIHFPLSIAKHSIPFQSSYIAQYRNTEKCSICKVAYCPELARAIRKLGQYTLMYCLSLWGQYGTFRWNISLYYPPELTTYALLLALVLLVTWLPLHQSGSCIYNELVITSNQHFQHIKRNQHMWYHDQISILALGISKCTHALDAFIIPWDDKDLAFASCFYEE